MGKSKVSMLLILAIQPPNIMASGNLIKILILSYIFT